jgi:hypothetical protein
MKVYKWLVVNKIRKDFTLSKGYFQVWTLMKSNITEKNMNSEFKLWYEFKFHPYFVYLCVFRQKSGSLNTSFSLLKEVIMTKL